MPWVDNLPSTLYLKSARLSPTTMPQGTQGAARYGIFYRRDLVSPSSRANYTLTSPTLSRAFLPAAGKTLQRTGETCGRAAFAPRLCRAIPLAGKMETNKSPRSCQQVFSRPSNIFWPRGLDTNIWYPIRHCDSCLAHSNQRANLQKVNKFKYLRYFQVSLCALVSV